MKTVNDVEVQFQEKVSATLQEMGLLAHGYRCSVELHGAGDRKKRRNARFEKHWVPDTDSICIRFERIQESTRPAVKSTSAKIQGSSTSEASGNPLSDLIRALDRAESRPGYAFVALKWFRDTALPQEGFAWASEESKRRNILGDAIDRRLILTSKVSNPRSPQFPVTAIRLNRLMPEVSSILGNGEHAPLDFQPVPIRGENLSATVLRDRR